MKTFAVFIFCFCISACCLAQVMFQKTYGGDSTETLSDMEPTNDGGYILCGSTNSFGNGTYNMYLVRTNAYGDTLWTKTYGDSLVNDYGYAVEQTTDSGFIITGSSIDSATGYSVIPLIKTDQSGNILWSKMFFVGGYIANSVLQTRDGGYILGGAQYSEAFILRTDSYGDTLWTKGYYSASVVYSSCSNILENSDSSFMFIFSGTGGLASNANTVFKIDSVGNLLWAKTYPFVSGGKIRHSTDGSYIIVGTYGDAQLFSYFITLTKINDSGGTLWSKLNNQATSYGADVQPTNDGGNIVTGYKWADTVNYYKAFLLKTDSIGNMLWEKDYGGTGNDYGYSVLQTADGGYALAGNSDSLGVAANDFYFVKTDSNGTSGCVEQSQSFAWLDFPLGIDTSINEVNFVSAVSSVAIPVSTPPTQTSTLCFTVGIEETNASENTFTLSPNPTHTTFTITTTAQLQNAQVEIYNVVGEKMYTEPVNNRASCIVHCALPPGVYFVTLQTNEGRVTRKLIKE